MTLKQALKGAKAWVAPTARDTLYLPSSVAHDFLCEYVAALSHRWVQRVAGGINNAAHVLVRQATRTRTD